MGSIINEEGILIALVIVEVLSNHIYKNIEAFPLNDGNISLRITLQYIKRRNSRSQRDIRRDICRYIFK